MESRPEVVTRLNIETTVKLRLPYEQIHDVVIAYLKKTYPEFRRRGLEIELNFLGDAIYCDGYKLEK